MNYISKTIEIQDKEYIILIGKNAQGNEDIIKLSNQNDIWFHIDNISGPHIILQNNGNMIPKRYLNCIATMFQEYKNNLPNKYIIIYTEIKNVKLTSKLGTVNISKTHKIKI
jgi:predicted ribosome quality control (RQC) complex YloA/Tae2 family protein